MSKPVRLFISQPMDGKHEDEIMAERNRIITVLSGACPELWFDPIDNAHHPDAPKEASRLWYLGRSIQMMTDANLVYFAKGWDTANGCVIERMVCALYGIPVIQEFSEAKTSDAVRQELIRAQIVPDENKIE